MSDLMARYRVTIYQQGVETTHYVDAVDAEAARDEVIVRRYGTSAATFMPEVTTVEDALPIGATLQQLGKVYMRMPGSRTQERDTRMMTITVYPIVPTLDHERVRELCDDYVRIGRQICRPDGFRSTHELQVLLNARTRILQTLQVQDADAYARWLAACDDTNAATEPGPHAHFGVDTEVEA